MKALTIAAAAATLVLPLIATSAPVSAATAHNSQAGSVGASSSAGDSTVGSRHVKHAAKHKM